MTTTTPEIAENVRRIEGLAFSLRRITDDAVRAGSQGNLIAAQQLHRSQAEYENALTALLASDDSGVLQVFYDSLDVNTQADGYRLHLLDLNYEPGHIAMFYGNGRHDIAMVEPTNAQDSSTRAIYSVNGEWRFQLHGINQSGELLPSVTHYCRNSDEITPSLEAAIANTMDGDDITWEGARYRIEWMFNNWFEIFIERYDAATRTWLDGGEVVSEENRGAALVDLKVSLIDMLTDRQPPEGVVRYPDIIKALEEMNEDTMQSEVFTVTDFLKEALDAEDERPGHHLRAMLVELIGATCAVAQRVLNYDESAISKLLDDGKKSG